MAAYSGRSLFWRILKRKRPAAQLSAELCTKGYFCLVLSALKNVIYRQPLFSQLSKMGNECLVKDGRIDDLKKAIVDEIYREKLYEEYHLSL